MVLPCKPTPERSEAEQRSTRSDLITLLFFLLYVLLAENVFVGLWALSVSQSWIGQTETTFSFCGVYGAAMLCSGAASFIGGFFGFLFGVPRSATLTAERTLRQVEETESEQGTQKKGTVQQETVNTQGGRPRTQNGRPRLSQNTNLENISDGLTKGLLGIGLSQLYRLGDLVSAGANFLGPVFGPGNTGKVVGVSIAVYGVATGFFLGYLGTRVYLTGVFERNDPT